ncbi:transposase [Endosaccharibacter trunci]|uniref:transposase n=1 Tax=Endosaccharibacter trunci TaxID=2812733 RepID=UPI003BF4BE18
MAPFARRVWQVEQRVPPLPALGRDRCVLCPAGKADRAQSVSRHDRQHGGAGPSPRGRNQKETGPSEAPGRSRDWFSTKRHARCDARGLLLGIVLTPGQTHDVQGFGVLFRVIAGRVRMLPADHGDNADNVRVEITFTGTRAIVPAKRGRRSPGLHS